MNNKILNILMFTVGAAIGSAVTWKIVKTKYKEIAQEEIDSVKEEYLRLTQKMRQRLNESATYVESSDDEQESTECEQEMVDYYNITAYYRSGDEQSNDENGKKGDVGDDGVPYINGPYVISPEEFSSSPPGYNAQPLSYYSDGTLADDWGEKLDIEETIGEDSLDHFGEYDDDIVYVRNERTEIDYEVTKDPRTYEEATREIPDPCYGQ